MVRIHIGRCSRRLARVQAAVVIGLGLLLGGCDTAEHFGPTESDGAPLPTVVAGIPFGVFGLPRAEYSKAVDWTGSLKQLSPDSSALVELATAQKHGIRMVVQLAGNRTTFKNADGTFNLDKWKARISQWSRINLAPYIADGTIIGHYLIDEPDATESWGGQTISLATLEEMARYSKSLWPTMATTVRVHPGHLVRYPWRYLDFAWAQWEGPLHSPSYRLTPEQFRDQQVADAKAAGLKLMLGMNFLDGGDGSSGIPGTYDLSVVKSRWQMSAAEVERVGAVFAATSYACGVINWRWSPDYPTYLSPTAIQLEGIRAFNARSDVQAALAKVANAARNRSASSCKRSALQRNGVTNSSHDELATPFTVAARRDRPA